MMNYTFVVFVITIFVLAFFRSHIELMVTKEADVTHYAVRLLLNKEIK
jgi:hypothetical protein